MFYKSSEIVWSPSLKGTGQITGIKLEGAFALQCKNRKLTPKEYEEMCKQIWYYTKPKDWNNAYIPSMLVMHDDSLLLSALYLRHSGDGHSLSAERNALEAASKKSVDRAITYSMHYAEPRDMPENRWLEYAFERWVTYAQFLLEYA